MNYAIIILFTRRRELKKYLAILRNDPKFKPMNADYLIIEKYLFDIECAIRILLNQPDAITPAFDYITRKQSSLIPIANRLYLEAI